MATEKPRKEAEVKFENSLDDAAHEVITHFEWMGLPDPGSDQRSDLLTEINMALDGVLRRWL